MSKQIERFFNKDADSLYRMAESYLRLEDSPFEFVNSNDPNRELIFCPTHTRSAAKSEMKASVFPAEKARFSAWPCSGLGTPCFPREASKPMVSLMDSPGPCLSWKR